MGVRDAVLAVALSALLWTLLYEPLNVGHQGARYGYDESVDDLTVKQNERYIVLVFVSSSFLTDYRFCRLQAIFLPLNQLSLLVLQIQI